MAAKRVPLRWKFFFGLLSCCLIPMLTVMLLVGNLTRDVKFNLFTQTRDTLTGQASLELVYLASNYATMLKQEELSCRIALQALADAAVRHLQGSGAAGAAPGKWDVIFDTQYASEKPFPAGLAFNEQYLPAVNKDENRDANGMMADDVQGHAMGMDMRPDMGTASGWVSFSDLAFHKAPGANADALARQARLLAPVLDNILQLYSLYGGKLFRVYAGFESGLHMTFPGHGDLAAAYDPRKRNWYTKAVQAGRMVWSLPLRDASSGRITITGSEPLYAEDGTLLGVMGIDFLWEQLLGSGTVLSSWSHDTTLLIAVPVPARNGTDSYLEIIAESSMEEKGIMQMAGRHRRMRFSVNAEEDMLREAMQKQGSGTLAMPWEGVNSLWAWAMLPDKSGYIIAIVPSDSVMRVPNSITAALEQASVTQRGIASASVLLTALLAFFAALFASNVITRPMYQMIATARRLAAGDFEARMGLRTGDERDTVIEAFNDIGPQLAELVSTRQALGIAREVQENLLPRVNPLFPGWEIVGVSQYCDETGGDFFDFFPLVRDGESVLTISVGDVSGHGIPSALLMTTARALIRGQAECGSISLADRIERVNRMLAKDVYGSGRFMTFFGMELVKRADTVSWVRAGHDPAIVYHASEDAFSSLAGSGLPLGVLDDSEYEELVSHPLIKGDIILIGTDGIWEARQPSSGEMFGKERVQQLMRDCADASAQELCDALLKALQDWRQGHSWKDDVTLVVVKKTR
ncbi:SpoIIE family protein phosphatase [Desulfovibrio mangrovi]|uniref:SpoIIE family protein phosphatase n=1 Tax=Desulfovibrio mangrovi TaxID=2976983 RepID=UPI002245920F|nr:SpoIIE family protein phosphatase [Desulfovibrio mangrovi]UZP66632.1 SpoIIE family protein phosphatase [Desulfovibrio mangrovi]